MSTGLIDLDQKLGGLHPSDLLILAGRPSMGKTALATNIAFNVARAYAFEPQPDGSARPSAAGWSGSSPGDVRQSSWPCGSWPRSPASPRTGSARATSTRASSPLRDAKAEIAGSPAAHRRHRRHLHRQARRPRPPAEAPARAGPDRRRLPAAGHRRRPLRRDNRVQEVSEITQGLKALAKELTCRCWPCRSSVRQVENREDKRPQLSDLRESGSIEQDADAVMFVYREAYYLAAPSRARARPSTCLAGGDGRLPAPRRGDHRQAAPRPIGTVRLHFNEDLTKFGNLARESRYVDFSRRPSRGPAPARSDRGPERRPRLAPQADVRSARLPYGGDE
jgi:replicative DNA helicase